MNETLKLDSEQLRVVILALDYATGHFNANVTSKRVDVAEMHRHLSIIASELLRKFWSLSDGIPALEGEFHHLREPYEIAWRYDYAFWRKKHFHISEADKKVMQAFIEERVAAFEEKVKQGEERWKARWKAR